MRWEVRTTDGTLVFKGYSHDGLDEDFAKANADERNKRAEDMGLKVRYEARRVVKS